MSTTFVAQILCGGVAALRKEIGNLQEIARAKMKRLHEMESVITGLNGRPSALSCGGPAAGGGVQLHQPRDRALRCRSDFAGADELDHRHDLRPEPCG